MPKTLKKKDRSKRHRPLEKQLQDDNTIRYRKPRKKTIERARLDAQPEDAVENTILPKKISDKILAQAKDQLAEVEQEERAEAEVIPTKDKIVIPSKAYKQKAVTISEGTDSENSDFSEGEEEEDGEDLVRFNGDYVEEIVEVEGGDEAALERLLFPERFGSRNLADLIADKIREKEEGAGDVSMMQGNSEPEPIERQFDPRVVEVYKQVGSILKGYTSGKLPKAFKIIPNLNNWEEVAYLTEPYEWSPMAMREATRIFASNLNPRNAQRFYSNFLLPVVRQDIQENKRLNYHLYFALRKAVYKPAAFYKGIILPLCQDGDNCTLREATIIGSVLTKVSVPLIHSAAVLMKLAEMPRSNAANMFIRILLNKKYNLPKKVVRSVVQYFMGFTNDSRALTVAWHQSLLVFAQRYHNDILPAEKEQLKALLKAKFHSQITPEIRRELFGAAAMREELRANSQSTDMEL